jgi:hypothetical protein
MDGKTLIKSALVGAVLALASSSHAAPWQADPQAIAVSDRVLADCQDAATDKGLKGFEWEKYVTQCIKDSKG